MEIENISENPCGEESNGAAAEKDPGQQVERLRLRVAMLEQELAASRAKCEQYRQFVTQWAVAKHSAEELKQFTTADDLATCLPLERFIDELEEIVHKNPRSV